MTTTQTDREQLAALCLSYLKPPKHSGGSWTLNPEALADAIIADGWRRTADSRTELNKWEGSVSAIGGDE